MGTDPDLEELLLKGAKSMGADVRGMQSSNERVEYLQGKAEFDYSGNRAKFSDVFWPPTTIPDIPVPSYEKGHWDKAVRHLIPEVDKTYYLNETKVEEIMYGFYSEGTMLLYGPTGTGKTSIAEQIAARISMPFLRVSGHGQMEVSELLGSTQVKTDPESNTPITVHCDTDVTLAAKYGGLLVLDEVFRIPSHCLMALQSLLEFPHKLNLQDAQGVSRNLDAPIQDFKLVLTDNTNGTGDNTGKYTAEVQDVSTLNRIRRSVYVGYMPRKEELNILGSVFKDMPEAIHVDMIQTAELVRASFTSNKIQQTMSIRELISWGQSIEDLRDVRQAFKYAVYNRCQDTDKEVVADIYRQIFAETIV